MPHIVNVLGQIGNEMAIEALINALTDTRHKFSISPISLPSVGRHAHETLMNIGEPALEPLHKALVHKNKGGTE